MNTEELATSSDPYSGATPCPDVKVDGGFAESQPGPEGYPFGGTAEQREPGSCLLFLTDCRSVVCRLTRTGDKSASYLIGCCCAWVAGVGFAEGECLQEEVPTTSLGTPLPSIQLLPSPLFPGSRWPDNLMPLQGSRSPGFN